jgi:hypothetical protein
MPDSSPLKQPSKRRPDESASDLDFAAAGESDGDDDSDGVGEVDPRELQPQQDRQRGTIATPPKGTAKSTPKKKAASAQPKGASSKKSASTITPSKIVKKQQGSAKFPTPAKVAEKASAKVPTSSNKTVGSKKLQDDKAQKHPKKQISAGIKAATLAEPSKVKKGAPTAPKAQVTAVKQPIRSTSAAGENSTASSGKPKSPRPASQQTTLEPNTVSNTASAVKEPVASNIARATQALKTPANTASPPDSSRNSEIFYSAASNPLNRSTSSSLFDTAANPSDSSTEDGLLKSALQTANRNAQTTDITPQTTVHNSTACCKKDPLSLARLSSKPQTQSTRSVAQNSIPMQEQSGPEPTKMDLDNDPGQIKLQSTRMDLDNVVQSLQFSLRADMANLAVKIRQSTSAISANTATQSDTAHSN